MSRTTPKAKIGASDQKSGGENATLYIIATPIGTRSDLSPRAIEVLRSVDFILCEDTRHTGLLMSFLGIKTKLVSLHKHNEDPTRVASLINEGLSGAGCSAALVSDAGTPGISDPGTHLIEAAHKAGIRVLNVPGPSSLTCALASCGFAESRSLFEGFLPRKSQDQEPFFARWVKCSPCIAVVFESPNRCLDLLEHLKTFFGESLEVCVSREISKHFEQHVRGCVSEVIEQLSAQKSRGECVISAHISSDLCHNLPLNSINSEGATAPNDLHQWAKALGVSRKQLYHFLLTAKGHVRLQEENL